MYWTVLALALLPAALHWWWTPAVVEPSASAVLPERHLATAQRVSFVTMLCTVTIILGAGWQAAWILPVQFVALTATTYRARRAMFGETWPFRRYLSWRLRLHVGMFGLWWFVALAPALIANADAGVMWWFSGLAVTIALAWHHWSGRVLLVLLRASRLERPDLDSHFQRVFASARVPAPDLWRAGEPGGRLANAFALLTLRQRGVLFFDSLLAQLPADEITAILAHEVAHLEQFHRRPNALAAVEPIISIRMSTVCVQTGQRTARRAGLGAAIVATAALVVGSPWFLLHAVADPLVAAMPSFSEQTVPATAVAQRVVDGNFSSVRVTPDGTHFLVFDQYDDAIIEAEETNVVPQQQRFVAAGFDGWSREIQASDVELIDDRRLLVVDRAPGSTRLRAEDLRTGEVLWTTTIPDRLVTTVQAAPDGRWRAFARHGRQFDRLDGRIGTPGFTSTRWTVSTNNRRSYLDTPRNDGSSVALAVAPEWREPGLGLLLSDWRETTQLLRVDEAGTTELATSNVRVECPALPIDVSGHVCLSFDGRSTRFWRIDLAGGQLIPIAETHHIVVKPARSSQHLITGLTNGQPLLANLDSQTFVTLIPDRSCWTQDVAAVGDVAISACGDSASTTVSRFQLPAAY
jgi:Zn-dependent protease with chaperone function